MAALASVAAIGALWTPAALANSPAQRSVADVTGLVLDCGSAQYTITSGSILAVFHDGTSASGNTNSTATITLQAVVAKDAAGHIYSIRGTEWFGATANGQQGTFEASATGQLQVVAMSSGSVDSVKVTQHITFVNGNVKDFNFGTCVAP